MARATAARTASACGFVTAPTLAEVYELLAPTGLTVNVELKTQDEELLRLCVEIARKYEMTGKVYYSSFFHDTLERIRKYESAAATAPLCGPIVGEPWDYVESLGAAAIHPYLGFFIEKPEVFREFHARGLRINPWTVDDETDMRRLIELGANALITNVPDIALKVVESYK